MSQECINAAIVCLQRFFMCHTLQRFHHFLVATAALSLATNVKAKHIIEVSDRCLGRWSPNSQVAEAKEQELLRVKNIMMQTLGPAGAKVESPHEHIRKHYREFYTKYFYKCSSLTEVKNILMGTTL